MKEKRINIGKPKKIHVGDKTEDVSLNLSKPKSFDDNVGKKRVISSDAIKLHLCVDLIEEKKNIKLIAVKKGVFNSRRLVRCLIVNSCKTEYPVLFNFLKNTNLQIWDTDCSDLGVTLKSKGVYLNGRVFVNFGKVLVKNNGLVSVLTMKEFESGYNYLKVRDE